MKKEHPYCYEPPATRTLLTFFNVIETVTGIALLIGGVVVTETVYAIPGLGSLTVDAVLNRDFPVIQGLVLLFSVSYVLINLLVDLSYLVLDPRIRY